MPKALKLSLITIKLNKKFIVLCTHDLHGFISGELSFSITFQRRFYDRNWFCHSEILSLNYVLLLFISVWLANVHARAAIMANNPTNNCSDNWLKSIYIQSPFTPRCYQQTDRRNPFQLRCE